MDAPTATLIAASIAGFVALVTTIVGYLNIKRQLLLTREEAERSRSHQRAMAAQQRKESAATDLWAALYQLQSERKLSPGVETQIVKAMMWVPDSVRIQIADLLVLAASGEGGQAFQSAISTSQQALLSLTKQDQPGANS